ncbi:MAG: hypothetical protein OHK0013_25430 [Sandaracinaceae bacterium]
MKTTRRDLLELLAASAGVTVLAPVAVGCGGGASTPGTSGEVNTGQGTGGEMAADPLAIPTARPEGWDALAFNRARGNAGAIPATYLPQINGADGDLAHLGKHLPYVPALAPGAVPAGFLALMWGDPSLGRTRHPNAPPTADNPEGHWYNWIRVRKATEADAAELESRYGGWPTTVEGDNGRYIAAEGTDVTADLGKNTVYLAQLPPDVGPGDLVRIHAHCLTHGEYVDFVTVPG